jgi:hypothetical protein
LCSSSTVSFALTCTGDCLLSICPFFVCAVDLVVPLQGRAHQTRVTPVNSAVGLLPRTAREARICAQQTLLWQALPYVFRKGLAGLLPHATNHVGSQADKATAAAEGRDAAGSSRTSAHCAYSSSAQSRRQNPCVAKDKKQKASPAMTTMMRG